MAISIAVATSFKEACFIAAHTCVGTVDVTAVLLWLVCHLQSCVAGALVIWMVPIVSLMSSAKGKLAKGS